MTKIQMIIENDEGTLIGLTCEELLIEHPTPTFSFNPEFMMVPRNFHFSAGKITTDNSPNLISLPDELLLRIRDYNIDVEHKRAIKQTRELKEKIASLKDQVRGWELRRDLAIEECGRYEDMIDKMIDKYPMAAAEIALQDGDLDMACYFSEKANVKEN